MHSPGVGVAAQNLAVLESKSFADAIYSIEPLVKSQTLEAQDNNEFRLNVLAAARDEMAQHSLLVGKAFIGDVAIDPLVHLPWVHDVTMLTIHSDFAIMIVQGGLIGYALFVTLFVGMAWLCSKGARLAARRGDRCSATVFDALLAMNAVFMLYISANPMLQDPKYALPYLITLPLAVFLATAGTWFLVEPVASGSSPAQACIHPGRCQRTGVAVIFGERWHGWRSKIVSTWRIS